MNTNHLLLPLPPPSYLHQQQPKEEPTSFEEMLQQLIENVTENNVNADSDDDDEDEAVVDHDDVETMVILEIKRRRLVVIETLLRMEQFPLRYRMKIDELINDCHTTLRDDIHDMIIDQRADDAEDEGLDSNRDTEPEVETALRVYPEVLSRRKSTYFDEEEGDSVETENIDMHLYPIACLMNREGPGTYVCNTSANSFYLSICTIGDRIQFNERTKKRRIVNNAIL